MRINTGPYLKFLSLGQFQLTNAKVVPERLEIHFPRTAFPRLCVVLVTLLSSLMETDGNSLTGSRLVKRHQCQTYNQDALGKLWTNPSVIWFQAYQLKKPKVIEWSECQEEDAGNWVQVPT